jgi:TRAP-type C4-dicarboxylate transport system permease small subunit
MWLSRITQRLYKVARTISWVINSVGLVTLAMMMFLTFVDVTLRYVFKTGLAGTFEITEYLMAITVSLGLAYCAVEKGHIIVDFVTYRLRQRTQQIVGAIANFLVLGMVSLITWQCFVNIIVVAKKQLVSLVLLIPAVPFAAIVAIGMAVLLFVVLIDFLDSLSKVVKK